MKSIKSNHSVSVVFVLTLAFAFAASILMVLMLGVNVYGNLSKASETQFNERVSLLYIATKVRSFDSIGAIRTGEFAGSSALFLDEEFYDEEFTTIIYTYDGWLRELFTDTESTTMEDTWLTGDAGMPLLAAVYVTFDMVSPHLLSVTSLDKNGNFNQMYISLRSEVDGSI